MKTVVAPDSHLSFYLTSHRGLVPGDSYLFPSLTKFHITCQDFQTYRFKVSVLRDDIATFRVHSKFEPRSLDLNPYESLPGPKLLYFELSVYIEKM